MGLHQIIRVPIAGPKPYNTLIYLEAALNPMTEGVGIPASVDLSVMARGTIVIPSPFVLKGWDPAVSPVQVPCSSTAWLSALGPQVNCDFQYAVDSVRAAGFDPTFSNPPFPDLNMDQAAQLQLKNLPFDGTFYFAIDIAYRLSAGAPENCVAYQTVSTGQGSPPVTACVGWTVPFVVKVCSYVLVWEPVTPKPPAAWGATQGPVAQEAAESLAPRSGREGRPRRGSPTVAHPPSEFPGKFVVRSPGGKPG